MADAPITNAESPAMKLHRMSVLLALLLPTDTVFDSSSSLSVSVGILSDMGIDKLNSDDSKDKDMEESPKSDSRIEGIDMDKSNVTIETDIDKESSSSEIRSLALFWIEVFVSFSTRRRSIPEGSTAISRVFCLSVGARR